MSAVRLARAATGRELIVKFEGCYHGHADSFLSEAGSGLATLGIAACPGSAAGARGADARMRPTTTRQRSKDYSISTANKIAAVIVEPIAANMGRGAAGGRISPRGFAI